MPHQGLGSDLGSTLVRFNCGVRVKASMRRRTLSQPCAEQQAQSVGNCGGAIADEQLAQRSPQRQSARQEADGRTGSQQRDPDQNRGYDERGSALQAKEIRKDGHEGAGDKEAEAGSAAQGRCRPPRERRSLSPRRSRREGVRSPRRDQVGVAELVGHLVRGDGGDVMLRAVIVQRKPERYAPQ